VLELVWRDTELSESLKLGGAASHCAATIAGTELRVACRAAEWRVQVARFDVSHAPHRFLMNEAVRVHTRRPALRASADGRFVVDEEASARLLDPDGRVQERFHFGPGPRQLFPMPDRHVWCDGDSGLELYAF